MIGPVESVPDNITVWRLVNERHKDTVFSGEGARLYGGRWNSKGIPLVYTASSLSLALLEMLVQTDPLPMFYVAVSAILPKGMAMAVVQMENLPEGWRHPIAPEALKLIGTEWVRSGISCAMRVPSSVLPQENNYLINPAHPQFNDIIIGKSEEIATDERLISAFGKAGAADEE